MTESNKMVLTLSMLIRNTRGLRVPSLTRRRSRERGVRKLDVVEIEERVDTAQSGSTSTSLSASDG